MFSNVFSELWQWFADLLTSDAATTCSAPLTKRGCAIDPNGGGSY